MKNWITASLLVCTSPAFAYLYCVSNGVDNIPGDLVSTYDLGGSPQACANAFYQSYVTTQKRSGRGVCTPFWGNGTASGDVNNSPFSWQCSSAGCYLTAHYNTGPGGGAPICSPAGNSQTSIAKDPDCTQGATICVPQMPALPRVTQKGIISAAGTSEQIWQVLGATGSFSDVYSFTAQSNAAYIEADGSHFDANDGTNITGLSTSPSLGTASCSNNICSLNSATAVIGTVYSVTTTGATVGTVSARNYMLQTPYASYTPWTPAWAFGNGSSGIVWVDTGSKYQISGNKVDVVFVGNMTSKGTSTGTMTITNLPYQDSSCGGGGIITDTYNFTGLTATPGILVCGSSAYMSQTISAGTSWITNSNVGNCSNSNPCQIRGEFSYFQ